MDTSFAIATGIDGVFTFGEFLLSIFAVILLVWAAWSMRVYYLRLRERQNNTFVLLEIKVPREIPRTPEAMELILKNALFQSGGASSFKDKYIDGKLLVEFSLELVSLEGVVRFFVRVPEFFKDTIEAQIYAQYPGVAIIEVEDYTRFVPPLHKKSPWSIHGVEYGLAMDSQFPIKTWRDYGMDKQQSLKDDEQKIDPLTPMLEMLGTIKQGEQFWVHMMVRANKGHDDWAKKGKKKIDEILQRDKKTKTADGASVLVMRQATKGEQDQVAAIENNIAQYSFECEIRAAYIAHNDVYSATRHLYLKNLLNSFNTFNYNAFKMVPFTGFGNAWQDVGDSLGFLKRERLLEDLRQRKAFSLFYRPTLLDLYLRFVDGFDRQTAILSAESLATIYHFPGRVLESPSIRRIESRRVEPPANLPT